MTTPMATQMALGVASIVLLVALILIFIGPTITPYGRKQWALIMVTLIVLWLPMSWYLFFIVGRSTRVDTQQAVLAAALNLVIGVPVFRFIVMNGILKRK